MKRLLLPMMLVLAGPASGQPADPVAEALKQLGAPRFVQRQAAADRLVKLVRFGDAWHGRLRTRVATEKDAERRAGMAAVLQRIGTRLVRTRVRVLQAGAIDAAQRCLSPELRLAADRRSWEVALEVCLAHEMRRRVASAQIDFTRESVVIFAHGEDAGVGVRYLKPRWTAGRITFGVQLRKPTGGVLPAIEQYGMVAVVPRGTEVALEYAGSLQKARTDGPHFGLILDALCSTGERENPWSAGVALSYGRAIVPALLGALARTDDGAIVGGKRQRVACLRLLGQIRELPERCVPLLARTLTRHENWSAYHAAGKALVRFGRRARGATPAILRAIAADESGRNERTSLLREVLPHIAEPTVKVLVALAAVGEFDRHHDERRGRIRVFGPIPPATVTALLARVVGEKDRRVREGLMQLLCAVDVPAARLLPVALKVIPTLGESGRITVLEDLAWRGSRKVLPLLLARLDDKVSRACLSLMGDRAADALIARLSGPQRKLAADVLKKMRHLEPPTQLRVEEALRKAKLDD